APPIQRTRLCGPPREAGRAFARSQSSTKGVTMVGVYHNRLGTVGGCNGSHQEGNQERKPGVLVWKIERGSRWNLRRLGRRLSGHEDLFRDGSSGLGLIQILKDGKIRRIAKAGELAPLIADRIPMRVEKDGK